MLASRISHPVNVLVSDVNAVAEGDLAHESTVPNMTKDEIGLLAMAFNRMTRSLREAREKEREAQRLAGEVNIAKAIHAQLIPSKRPDLRRAQYCELVDRMGAKLGGRGFALNEEFHHIVWMGDLNYHCKDVTGADALALIRQGRHMQLLLDHDELLDDKEKVRERMCTRKRTGLGTTP